MTRAITRIIVKNLFGRYDYSIPIWDDYETKVSRVCLLYGENGTGKTTILKLVFHLLSSEENRGHRSFVATTPFQLFQVGFSDDSCITATRSPGQLTGKYNLELQIGSGKPESAMIEPEDDTGHVTHSSISPRGQALFDKASKLGLDVFYLGDSRDVEGDSISPREWRTHRSLGLPRMYGGGEQLFDERLFIDDNPRGIRRQSTLVNSIHRTEQALNREFMLASSTGETDARQVYANILNTIASDNAPEQETLDEEVRKLKRDLQQLALFGEDFARFGLGSPIDVESLSASLETSNTTNLPVVFRVLRSFLEDQNARLNALLEIYERINSFVETSNEYFSDKSVDFDVFDGLTIQVPNGALEPDLLSSGERHLLLLFLNVITPSRQPPLFIIDEPELSLNIKWQRSLVDTLLTLSERSGCQFLMATHSIELLTKHSEHVYRLAHNG